MIFFFLSLIKAHQEFIVVASSKKLLILRCKKTKECQCQWKFCAMVVKDTCLFVINKYKGPHTCVNPCLNQDHHQLDSNMVAVHIKAIKAQFTLSTAAIPASVMEKWGYRISYKKALDDILHLSGTTLEKLMKQWLKAYYLFLNIYIDCWVLGKNLHA